MAGWPSRFGTNSFIVSAQTLPALSNPHVGSGGQFTFMLSGVPLATYVIQATADLTTWNPIATNTVPAAGVLTFSDPAASQSSARYYRAVQMP